MSPKGRGDERGLSTQRGRVSAAALAALAAAALVAGSAWWFLGGVRPPAEAAAQPGGAPPQPEARLDNLGSERNDLSTAVEPGDRKYRPELFDESRYEGTARLEVILEVEGPFAGPWTLSLEPSKVIVGGEHAVAQELRFLTGQRQVVVDDVALGGYVIRAQAEGMECSPQYVQFARPNDLDVTLPIRLYPAGTLSGRVLDPDGDPLAGLPVVARRRDAPGERSATTDRAGAYAFERLPDGDWLVEAGYPGAPLVSREVGFSAPGFSMPDLVTPRLAEWRLRVVDGEHQPLEGVTVSVLGLASGAREGKTDAEGVARMPHCVGGAASVIAELDDLVTTQRIEFQPGVVSEHTLRLVRR